jgi:hypothetical protein
MIKCSGFLIVHFYTSKEKGEGLTWPFSGKKSLSNGQFIFLLSVMKASSKRQLNASVMVGITVALLVIAIAESWSCKHWRPR